MSEVEKRMDDIKEIAQSVQFSDMSIRKKLSHCGFELLSVRYQEQPDSEIRLAKAIEMLFAKNSKKKGLA